MPNAAKCHLGLDRAGDRWYLNRFPQIAYSVPEGKRAPYGDRTKGDCGVVKLTLRDKETAQEAVRRFRKLVERSGIKKEIRVREFYEKPSETRRRARLRAERRTRRNMLGPTAL